MQKHKPQTTPISKTNKFDLKNSVKYEGERKRKTDTENTNNNSITVKSLNNTFDKQITHCYTEQDLPRTRDIPVLRSNSIKNMIEDGKNTRKSPGNGNNFTMVKKAPISLMKKSSSLPI